MKTPTKCTSSCSSTFQRSRTARRTRASSVATSFAVAPPRLLMKLACSGETSASSFAPSLSTGRFDQARRLVAGRIAEARAGVGKRDRLRLLAAHETRLHLRADVARARAGKLQRRRAIRRRRARASNGGRDIVRWRGGARDGSAIEPTPRARTRQSRGRCRRSSAAIRRSCPECRRANRCRSAPAEAAFAVTSAISADPPASTTTRPPRRRTCAAANSPASRKHDAAHAAVADEHVASAADDPPRHPSPQAEAHELRQLRFVLARSRTRRPGRRSSTTCSARAARRSGRARQRSHAAIGDPILRRRLTQGARGGNAHARTEAARASSGAERRCARRAATSVMSPAPSISTIAPGAVSSSSRSSSSSTRAT